MVRDLLSSLTLEGAIKVRVVLSFYKIRASSVIDKDATSAHRDPQGSKENQVVSSGPGTKAQRKGIRNRTTNSRLKDYVH
jgi:hypothetical protein